MRFEVKDGSGPVVKTGTRKADGRAFSVRLQEVWVGVNGEVRRINVMLNAEHPGYAPGLYELDESSFGFDRWGELTLRYVNLRSVAKPAAVGAAAR
jgi:hypothetical protein